MNDLNSHEDVVVEILCRLPKKSLARFKCVSKQWLNLISDRKRVFPTTTTQAGLVFHCCFPFVIQRTTFFRVDNNGSGRLICTCLTNIRQDCLLLLGSCDGFLLFGKLQRRHRKLRVVDFMVRHLVTNRSWNVSPPTCPEGRHLGMVSYGHHFKLVLFSVDEEDSSSSLDSVSWCKSYEYSSENEEWSDERWRSPSITIPNRAPKTIDSGKSVFLNGALHWIWGNYLLIYRVGKKDCELIKFPPFPNHGGRRKRQDQCIWKSEGYLNYCQVSAAGDRIGIWTLLHKGDGNDYSFKWLPKHDGILSPSMAEIGDPISFSPFAFNDDFEIVYLMCEGRVFSYSLTTKETKEACASPFERYDYDRRALCITLPFQYISPLDIAATTTGDIKLCDPCSGEVVKKGKKQL